MVAPETADSSSAHTGSADAVMKPATEPPASTVTGDDRSPVVERRRTVALAGHRHDETTARSGLSDPAASVRSTALGALERLGELTDDEVEHSLTDPDAAVRRRAVELAATRASVAIGHLLDDPDDTVVEMTAWSLGEQGERSAVGALSVLASVGSGHGDPLCREAAVAALGAIGDPAGLPAVLAALEDKPAVRRRAAVALAAFDGPAVEAALRRCLEDRDWQVRQVAEDLLAVE
jgi:HEAT repeat protein